MRSHGNKITGLVLTILVFVMFGNSRAQDSAYYYVCSYESDGWGTNVLFSKIDLESKSIIYSISLPLEGEIQFKKPIILQRQNSKFLFITSFNGLPAKNSEILETRVSNYAILDESGAVIFTGQVPNVQFTDFWYSLNNAVNIEYLLEGARWNRHMKGVLRMDNRNRISIVNPQEDPFNPDDYPEIGGFKYFERIKNDNDRIYWVVSNGVHLLALDVQNNVLLDSLTIGTNMHYSYLFSLSPNDSLVYSFVINCNVVGGPEEYKKLTIDPSYLKTYWAYSLSLIDSTDISYPDLDSGYVFGELGICDWVGDYLVYFFFNGEDYRYFCPAMLFIFDTRTNETTWLRVGWR